MIVSGPKMGIEMHLVELLVYADVCGAFSSYYHHMHIVSYVFMHTYMFVSDILSGLCTTAVLWRGIRWKVRGGV